MAADTVADVCQIHGTAIGQRAVSSPLARQARLPISQPSTTPDKRGLEPFLTAERTSKGISTATTVKPNLLDSIQCWDAVLAYFT